jgi:type I restriction enzyme S subunit
MSDWKIEAISDFGEVISGGTPATNIPDYWGGDIVWVTPADLSKIHFAPLWTSEKKITKMGLSNSSANLIPKKSIVISSRAPIGYIAVPEVDFSTNQGCKSVKLKPGHDPIFHYFNFKQHIEEFKRRGEGTTFAEISKKEIEKLRFSFPPLPHQRKIARILTTVDNIIEKTEAAIAKYKAIKQGMMHDLFTRGIDVKTGKLRPKFEDAPQLYKETPLGWIPKDWAVKRLDELTKDGLRNGYFKKPEYVGWGYKLINVSDLYQPYEIDINQKDVQRVFATPNDYSKYEVQVGDLFFTRSSLVLEGIAHCNIVLKLPEPSVWECHVVRLRPDKQKINPEFLGFYCRTYEARLFLMSIAKQVTMTTISQPDIAKLPVCVPTNINEQKEIAKRLRSIDRIIQKEEISKLKHQKLKSGLMQDLLTGRKEVTPDPEDYQEIEN